MGARIRVLVNRPQGGSSISRLVYYATVYDDRDSHQQSLWTCDHPHIDPASAYQCARDWLERTSQAFKTAEGMQQEAS